MFTFSGWTIYVQVYVILTLVYLWYRFFSLFLVEFVVRKKEHTHSYNNQLISVIVPFYNEKPELLRKCLHSLLNANGNTQIIVVDDGSPDKTCAALVRKVFSDKIIFVRYELNKGKRHAQGEGFRQATGEIIVTVDSDTIVEPDALIKICEPILSDKKVGATTGNVKVLNKNKNTLTQMIAARYWNAFNIERKSLSAFGIVTCCSGVLSAYRRNLFEKLLPNYLHQKFLGVECTYGDDRHLTNLVLERKFKVLYVEDAVCYTEAPVTYRQFLKQQIRWKKSFLRESVITLRFAFKHSFLLPFEVLLNLILPFWSLAIRLSLLATMILVPSTIPFFIVSILTVAIIRNFFLFFEDKKLALYSIPYAFVHELVLFWLYFYALFTLRERGWGTR